MNTKAESIRAQTPSERKLLDEVKVRHRTSLDSPLLAHESIPSDPTLSSEHKIIDINLFSNLKKPSPKANPDPSPPLFPTTIQNSTSHAKKLSVVIKESTESLSEHTVTPQEMASLDAVLLPSPIAQKSHSVETPSFTQQISESVPGIEYQPNTQVYATVRDMSNLLSGVIKQEKHNKASEKYGILSENSDNVVRRDSGYLSRQTLNPDNLSFSSNLDLLPTETHDDKVTLTRRAIINELLETERGYVADLKMLVENCFDRLHAVSWLPLDQKCLLIRNASDLLKFQQEFLAKMESVISECALTDNYVMSLPLGDLFIEMEDRFKVYTQYCTQHDGALKILSELEKKPEMISFLADFKGKTQTRLDVRDFLIKPVQRICRYPLILNELIKLTDKESSQFPRLIKAHLVMQSVAADIDSAKWYLDNLQRTDKLFARLEIPESVPECPVRSETGEIVLGNVLFVYYWDKGGPRFVYMGVFLFADYLFIVKIKKSTIYQLKFCLLLRDYVESETEILNHGWCLTHKHEVTKRFIFGAANEKERKVWLDIIRKVLLKTDLSRHDLDDDEKRRASIGSPPSVHTRNPSDSTLKRSRLSQSPELSTSGSLVPILLKRNSSTGSLHTLSRRISSEAIKHSSEIVPSPLSKSVIVSDSDVPEFSPVEASVHTDTTLATFTHRSASAASRRSFWRQMDSFGSERTSVSPYATFTVPQIRRGPVDIRLSDVVTPNIESLTFVAVAGLIVPKSNNKRISNSPTINSTHSSSYHNKLQKAHSTSEIAHGQTFTSTPPLIEKRPSKGKLHTKLKSWARSAEDNNFSLFGSSSAQNSPTATMSPTQSFASLDSEPSTTPACTPVLSAKSICKVDASTDTSELEVVKSPCHTPEHNKYQDQDKRRTSIASSIRKSFSFVRNSIEIHPPLELSPQTTQKPKSKNIFSPVLQTIRLRSVGSRTFSQLFHRKYNPN